MLRPVLAAAAVASLSLGAPAAAAPVTRTALPSSCQHWDGDGVLALACDPTRRAAAVRVRLGRETGAGEHGVARVFATEPLQAGETLTLRWRHPSARGALSVQAAAPEGPRRVVLDLRARPARVDVTAQPDGSLVVRTPAGAATVPAPAPYEVAWAPRTARAAAARLLAAVDRLERSNRALRTVCAALDRDVFASFELEFGDPQSYPCWSALGFHVFGDENVPRPTATVHRGLALAVRGGRALLSTRLAHRLRTYSDSDPRRVAVQARVLLVRDGPGIWRLATVEPLLALVAIEHRRAFTDAELDRLYRHDAADGRRLAAREARAEAARQAATVDGSAPAPCAAALAPDPPGDASIGDSAQHARNQAAHADVDLLGAAVSGGCVAVRSAGPLPARFDLELYDDGDHRFDVRVADGRVLVQSPAPDDAADQTPAPVAGAAAHLDQTGLVVLLPSALTGRVALTLAADRDHLRYFDDAAVTSR